MLHYGELVRVTKVREANGRAIACSIARVTGGKDGMIDVEYYDNATDDELTVKSVSGRDVSKLTDKDIRVEVMCYNNYTKRFSSHNNGDWRMLEEMNIL